MSSAQEMGLTAGSNVDGSYCLTKPERQTGAPHTVQLDLCRSVLLINEGVCVDVSSTLLLACVVNCLVHRVWPPYPRRDQEEVWLMQMVWLILCPQGW